MRKQEIYFKRIMSIQIIGWLIWVVVLIWAVLWTIGWRIAAVSQKPMQKSTGVFIFFLWVIDVLFFIFDWNKLHILWAIPVSFVFSMFVVLPGIPIISTIVLFLSGLFLAIVCVGWSKNNQKENL